MNSSLGNRPQVWFAAGIRTPFAKVDGPLAKFDAIALSVPVVQEMVRRLDGATPDFAVWGPWCPVSRGATLHAKY
jgi:acetyl-CoA C-acetyltransferase